MRNLKSNIFLKIASILLIGLLLTIPTQMIKNLIHERENTKYEAIQEVSSKWGNEQTIAGPIISIPYFKYVKQESADGRQEKVFRVKDHIHLLPEILNIEGELTPLRRKRGIYEVVLYDSRMVLKGHFSPIQLSGFDIAEQDLQLDKAFLTVGISDLRGIEDQINLRWNEQELPFQPGAVSTDIVSSGIHAFIDIEQDGEQAYAFQLEINLKGSQLLYFTPVGKITDINMTSIWDNPSFNGAFLPDSHEVSEGGFKANWNVLHLNRNYPQMWLGHQYDVRDSDFGVDLLLPVDNYLKSYRSINYALMFISFTFVTFFFIEILSRAQIHPVQYTLVGLALVIFYTLLLSVSEHMAFNLAFILSSLATLLLISGYVKAILKSWKITGLIGGILLLLYSFIFVVLQLQDLALLIGSIGIFILLAIIMFVSRKIDWYGLAKEGN